MANIFKENKAVNEHPNRNNFDLSKKSNVSLKFGTLYPVYCQPVVPGDSFDINVAYNLKLMPVVFPVQTKMRAHMHFFYVRNKNLWSNWENWISNLPNATQSLTPHPYISVPDDKFKNGSIHDFLGVPTSCVSSIVRVGGFSITQSSGHSLSQVIYRQGTFEENSTFGQLVEGGFLSWSFGTIKNAVLPISFIHPLSSPSIKIVSSFIKDFLNVSTSSMASVFSSEFLTPVFHDGDIYKAHFTSAQSPFTFDGVDTLTLSDELFECINTLFQNDAKSVRLLLGYKTLTSAYPDSSYVQPAFLYETGSSSNVINYSDLNIDLYSQYLHINALPYRAYESIYWAYYNNNVVSPMTINGDVQYNRYNTNLGDGADTTDYHLFQRNYELDFLTSSLPSPQQGVAPLVGMTALGDVTIEDENGITTAHAEIDNDGTISKVVLTSPAASVEHARTAMNIAASGMSINDFRQTNALQRVLETNIRKGYRYMDFIAGHFGKEPEYRELDMPEFIGGFSRDVNVSTVVSQADTLGDDSGKSLGSYGGYAQVVGGTNHAIRHYCDDYGYIIGILSVVPTPCYSQLLPKHMIAPDNFLDYYFPEFSQSGLMPITYKEVAPIQSYLDSLTDNTKSLEDTFGYQRPNYDMVSAVDEVHGEFRGALRNYVINRIFDTRPELGRSFLQINPSEINDIFVNTNPDDDTIIGEIGFAVHAKRPVPRVVIPNLGR